MKTFTRISLAVVVVLSVAFMSAGRVSAQTTGGAGMTHVSAGPWFVEYPGAASLTIMPVDEPIVPTFPDTGHELYLLSEAYLTASGGDLALVCFQTPASGGAIFWWEPTLGYWVPLANFQTYPLYNGVSYTCVQTWYTGTFGFGYIVP